MGLEVYVRRLTYTAMNPCLSYIFLQCWKAYAGVRKHVATAKAVEKRLS